MNENTVIQHLQQPPSSEANQQPLPVGTLIEGFEIRAVIGVGGFGIVYKAWDNKLERQVALKEYLPASLAVRMPSGDVQVRDERHSDTFNAGLRSFINEARLLAQFDHAALVKVYHFWEMAGTAYMVMPLYQGITLKQYVEQQQAPLQESLLLEWLEGLTEALEVMHAQQCYHRDISPENIIIQEGTGLPILLDFGAARRAIGNVSQPFTVILKASYAPIEQYAEVPSLSQGPWTDVYALAAVAHFLITGKTPPSSVARMVNDSYNPLAANEELPFSATVRRAIDLALAVQPQDRTASMSLFWQGLRTVHTDVLSLFESKETEAVSVEKNPLPPVHEIKSKANKTERKKLYIFAGAGGLLAVLVAVLITVFSGENKEGEQSAAIPTGPAAESSSHETGTEAASATLDNTSATATPMTDEALLASSASMPSTDVVTSADEATSTATTSAASRASSTAASAAPNRLVEPAFQSVLDQASDTLNIQMKKTVLKIDRDLLDFTVTSPISGYVTVFVKSTDNTLLQLLPNKRLTNLEITAGKPLKLPPSREAIRAAGPAGTNQFLVVVTGKKRSYRHLSMQDYYGFGLIQNDRALENPDAVGPGLEGISECGIANCKDDLAAAWFSVDEVE